MLDFRNGSEGDISAQPIYVRYSPESGHSPVVLRCQLWANSGHAALKLQMSALPLKADMVQRDRDVR
jgi:hypothetical protein